jgi:hypothetical protein
MVSPEFEGQRVMATAIVNTRRCGFCEKYECHVRFLVAGPSGFICDACVGKASELLAERLSDHGSFTGEPLSVGVNHEKFAYSLIRKHFYPANTNDVVTSSRVFPARMRADLQKALDARLGTGQGTKFFGVRKRHDYETTTFAVLLDDTRDPVVIAPPRYEEVDVGENEPVRCLETGLWLKEEDGQRYAVFLSPQLDCGRRTGSHLEVAVTPGTEGLKITSGIFQDAEEALRRAQSYRGKVLSLESTDMYSGQAVGVRVHRLEPVQRDELVLAESTVKLLERNVINFAKYRCELSRHKMPLKKGLLFYGPPGTGKTYTIRYLASQLPGHTMLLMTAEQMGLIQEYIALARLLQPSIVVIEDADLIARERDSMSNLCQESALNRLLNEMDGLAEDAEMIFVLTTNRPEMIEPAVAGRPGRIDQAIEFPLPDEPSRKKLAQIYARGLPVADETLQEIAVKTKKVSAAFIKELMRRSAQFYVERGSSGNLSCEEIDEALHEMLFVGGLLNVKLLGGDIGNE